MAFITPKELETHLYKENIEAISREDETIHRRCRTGSIRISWCV